MRDGRHVLDQAYGQASGLESADRRLPSRTGTLHVNFYRFHSVLHGLLGRLLRRHLSCEWSRLFRAGESGRTAARPGHDVAAAVRDRHLSIIERRKNMRDTFRHIPYDFLSGFKFFCFGHLLYFLLFFRAGCGFGCGRSFFLSLCADSFLGSFAGSCIRTCTLTAYRQTLLMAAAAV